MRTWHVLVVGRGRLGQSVARGLRAAGVRVHHWSGRGAWPARTPSVEGAWIAVADPFVHEVAARLASRLPRTTPVLHASGALDRSVLASLSPRPRGAMHPLISFASPEGPSAEGASAVLAGDRAAVALGRRLARALGWRVIARPLHGARYHAGAAMLANGAAALAHRSVAMLVGRGVAQRDAELAVAGLLRSVADNVARVGVPRALTGPIVRGDAATVKAHRAALDARERAVYDAVAALVLETAIDAGLPPASARAIRTALRRA